MPIIDNLILVPMGEEWTAIRPVLCAGFDIKSQSEKARTYYRWAHPFVWDSGELGFKPRPSDYLSAGLVLFDIGTNAATEATTTALERWKPNCVFLLGIAGGLAPQWIKLGDVVVAKQTFAYELGAVDDLPKRIEYRPRAHPDSATWRDQLQTFKTTESYSLWQQACVANAPESLREHLKSRPPELHFEDFASGDKVIRSTEFSNALREHISSNIRAVEMEAAGVHYAVWKAAASQNVIMIRGISDYADRNKTDLETSSAEAWRGFAAANAARLMRMVLDKGPVEPISTRYVLNADAAAGSPGEFHNRPVLKFFTGVGVSNLAFLNLLSHHQSSPKLLFHVQALLSGGTPAPLFQIQLIEERLGVETYHQPIKSTGDPAQFTIEPSQQGVRLKLFVSVNQKPARIEFSCQDEFGRTAHAAWLNPLNP